MHHLTFKDIKAPEDFEDALDYIITHSEKITNLDSSILYRFYKYGQSTDEICEDLDVDEVDLSDHMLNICNELQLPKNLSLLVNGMTYLGTLKERYGQLKSAYGTELFDSIDKSETPIEGDKFTNRTINFLYNLRADHLEDLLDKDESFKIYRTTGAGVKTLAELKMLIKEYYNIDILSKKPENPKDKRTWKKVNELVKELEQRGA